MRIFKLALVVTVLFFCCTRQMAAQSPVIIDGKFQPAVESTPVFVYKPYGGYFNTFYPDAASEARIENSTFQIQVQIDKPGFIRLLSKGMPKTYFYAEPGDTVRVTFMTDSTGLTKTVYAGTNAAGNYMLAGNKMNDRNYVEEKITALLQSGMPATQIFERLKEETEKNTLPLHIYFERRKITAACYYAITTEIEQKMLFWAGTYCRNYFENNTDTTIASKQRRTAMQQIAQLLFDYYDPYRSNMLTATTNYSNCHTKSFLQQKGIVAAQPPAPYWAQWDKKFGTVVNQIASLDYAPDTNQMYFLGTSFLTAMVFKTMSEDDFTQVFNAYYNKFPKSHYIPLITSWLAAKKSGTTATAHFKHGLYRMSGQKKQLIEEDLKGLDTITTLQSLVQKNFKGKPVFVDVWATWCSPCIAEFNNEPALRKFLWDNDITMLYVSIDNKGLVETWQKMAVNFQLSGYHYLANQQVFNHINSLFVGIPRYLLFNAKGELVQDNLSRPHTGNELFKQISKALGK